MRLGPANLSGFTLALDLASADRDLPTVFLAACARAGEATTAGDPDARRFAFSTAVDALAWGAAHTTSRAAAKRLRIVEAEARSRWGIFPEPETEH